MVRMAVRVREDHKATFQTSVRADKDRQEATEKKEFRTIAGKAMIGLAIEIMRTSIPTVKIDQPEVMMIRRIKAEAPTKATLLTKTEEDTMMKMKIEMRNKAIPETRTEEVTMMKMTKMMGQGVADQQEGTMTTMKKKMRIDTDLAEETKEMTMITKKMRIDKGLIEGMTEMTMKKEEATVVPAVDSTMMMKRKNPGVRGQPEDMRTMMRKKVAIGTADPVLTATGDAPTSDIMIESNNLTHSFHLKAQIHFL